MTRDETLTCNGCERQWSRIVLRGRKPPLCPMCKKFGTPEQRETAAVRPVAETRGVA